MIVKRLILKKILQSGYIAEINLVKLEGEYEAALFLNGKPIAGPPLPRPLTPPKDELSHWMGNRPTIGLTRSEAERIIAEVEGENGILRQRCLNGWQD